MEKSTSRFESLSLLASREQWCWNLACTTCGHMVFRWGLKALVQGVSPEEDNWSVHWGARWTSQKLENLNGPILSISGWPIVEQKAIQEAARGTRLWFLGQQLLFTDMLGHLGVLLRYTADAERTNLVITRELIPQLAHYVEPNSPADKLLQERVRRNEPILWSDLEIIERSYKENKSRI